jgi:hypothetical protein
MLTSAHSINAARRNKLELPEGTRFLKKRNMGEEQSSFKVTDRRLFNADGTPREIDRAAEPAKDDAVGTADQTTSINAEAAGAEARATTAQAANVPEPDAGSQPSSPAAAGAAAAESDEVYDEEDLPGAKDPASFVNFLMSLASNAAASLGMMPHPATGESGVDLEVAKHWIDVLGMLRQKTNGNLAAKEDQIFEGILADLRMQYVSLTSTPAPSKFTARDITGAK